MLKSLIFIAKNRILKSPENLSYHVKEFLKFNCDISKYVPKDLVEIIKNKYYNQ